MPIQVHSIGRAKQDYFEWLCERVCIDRRDVPYRLLAKELHARQFTWCVPNDDNRAMDGEALREEYIYDAHPMSYSSVDDRPCSVFEMLIALARRMDFTMNDLNDSEDHTELYFWEMMRNLGLVTYTDDNYNDENNRISVDHVLTVFLNREYRRDGSGGIFPIKYSRTDQRKLEIWYQMNAYIKEHYVY